jgi:hypothetical protein
MRSVHDPPRAFSLTRGGPFFDLMIRVHLVTPTGSVRIVWLALFAWLPLVVGEGVRFVMGMTPDPTLFDISLHVRLLVALPLILFSERLLESASRSAIASVYAGNFADRGALNAIVVRGEHLRDAKWPELAILALVLVNGQLVLWRIVGSTGFFHGGTGVGPWSFPRLWYVAVALPLAQLVMFRWIWRWVIWSFMLARIAKLPLSLLATHPDRAIGLSCLARPVSAFSAFSAAVGAVIAAAWGTQLLAHRTTLVSLLPTLFVLLVALLALATGPLLLFCGHLYRVRRRGLAQYGDFATGYIQDFHSKWIEPGIRDEQPLGSPDIQSLSDLGTAFGVVSSTRLFVFGLRTIVGLWGATLLPFAPLFASTVTVEELLQRIMKTVIGGLPL